MSDAPASGTDLNHVDDRHLDRQSAPASETVHTIHFKLAGLYGMTPLHRAQLCRRPPHIKGEKVGVAGTGT